MQLLHHYSPCGRALGFITLSGHRLWKHETPRGTIYAQHTEWLPSFNPDLASHQHFGELAGKQLVSLACIAKTDRDSWHEWWLYDADSMTPGEAGEAVKTASEKMRAALAVSTIRDRVHALAKAHGWHVYPIGDSCLCVQRERVEDPHETGAETLADWFASVEIGERSHRGRAPGEVHPHMEATTEEGCADAAASWAELQRMVRVLRAGLA